jgi:phenylacetaldehyde dehydrogenase
MSAQETLDRQLGRVDDFLNRSHALFIDGAWTDAESGRLIDVVNPATGAPVAKVQTAGADDADRAVGAARTAFDDGPWPRIPPAERTKVMHRLADLIESATEEIAILETLDNGMPLAASTRAVGIGVANLRYFAGWCGKIAGEVHNPTQADTLAYTVKEPIGVAALITPWNFPFGIATAKLAQALAAGCTVVLKPAELTPLSALKLAGLVAEADFPPGVINIIPGSGRTVGQRLVEHEQVDKISFTGSTATGKAIIHASTGNLKRLTLELGGKSPSIIFPDADLEKAIPGAAMAVFANAGQVCVAGSRLFVHRDVFDEVIDGITEFAKSIKVGPGLDPTSQIGPLVSQGQFDRVAGYVQSGVEEGGHIVHGGERIGTQGYFMQPTVIADVRPDMRITREEIFGPVISAMPFEDDDLTGIVAQANDTQYGLAAYLWTRDISRVHMLASRIRAGTIHVNGGAHLDPAIPSGGYKQSGWGRESGAQGVEAYLETKAVIVKL